MKSYTLHPFWPFNYSTDNVKTGTFLQGGTYLQGAIPAQMKLFHSFPLIKLMTWRLQCSNRSFDPLIVIASTGFALPEYYLQLCACIKLFKHSWTLISPSMMFCTKEKSFTDCRALQGWIRTVANDLHKSLNFLIDKAKMEHSIEQQFILWWLCSNYASQTVTLWNPVKDSNSSLEKIHSNRPMFSVSIWTIFVGLRLLPC